MCSTLTIFIITFEPVIMNIDKYSRMDVTTFNWLYDVFGREFFTILIPRLEFRWFVDLAKAGGYSNKTRASEMLRQIMRTRSKGAADYYKSITCCDITGYYRCSGNCNTYMWDVLTNGSDRFCWECLYDRFTNVVSRRYRMSIMLMHFGYTLAQVAEYCDTRFKRWEVNMLDRLWCKYTNYVR